MIREFIVEAESEFSLHDAQEKVMDVISHMISATMLVNPPGDWEMTNEQTEEPIGSGKQPFVTRQTFRFAARDNITPVEPPVHAAAE